MAFNRHRNRRRTKALFDDSKPLTPTRRAINTAGDLIQAGDIISKKITTLEFRRNLWISGRAVYKDDMVAASPKKKSKPKKDNAAPSNDIVDSDLDKAAQTEALDDHPDNIKEPELANLDDDAESLNLDLDANNPEDGVAAI